MKKKEIVDKKLVNRQFKEFCKSHITCKPCEYGYKHIFKHPGADGQCKSSFILDRYNLVKKG